MKKIMAILLTAVMLCAFGVQAFAADSISGVVDEGQVQSDQGAVSWDEIQAGEYPTELMSVLDAINTAGRGASARAILGRMIDLSAVRVYDTSSVYLEDGESYFENMYFLSAARTLNFYDVQPSEDNPVKVTFTANNMTDTMKVYVLYYCPEHGWELLETTRAADNQVTAAFHSGPGIAVLVYIDDAAQADNAEGVAPKMGDTTAAASMGVAAVALMLFGIYALMRSRRHA